MKNKSLKIIILVSVLIFMVPLLAMFFTDEVNWTIGDFFTMGLLLSFSGLLVDLVLRKMTNKNFKFFIVTLIMCLFLLIWAQLATGFLEL